jgi:hypothetical protein
VSPNPYYDTIANALAHAAPAASFTLGAPGTLQLQIDDSYYGDNAGTVTVQLSGPPSTTTPEPATWGLIATGLAALVVVRRRTRAA